ncbi:RNA-directed DNA polymerase, eukaryota, reverse transcriptase zinc-binding domain protein [Tanacetum coccineum]
MENSDGMNKREAFNVSIQYEHGDVQRMKGNDGNAAAKPLRMQRMKGTIASNQMRQPIRGLRNPNTESMENAEYDGVSASCGESVTQPMVNPSRNNDLMYGTQPTKVVRDSLNPNAEVEEPRVLESLTQIHKDQKHADGGQSDESFHAGFSKPMPSVTPTSFGEFSMMNPSGEIDTDVEEVAWAANPNGGATRLFGTDYLNYSSSIGMNMNAFAEGDGVRVSTQTGRFVKVSSSTDSGSQQSYGANGLSLSSHDYMHPTDWTLGDQHDLTTETNSDTPIVQSVDINVKPNSYAGAAGASNVNQPKDHVNFRPMVAENVFDGVNISIPRKVVKKVSIRFENTLYGYFIGKRMAFPVVEYYARNNWGKHRLKRIMMNAKGFFFFKFDTRAGLEKVLEEGPWMIRNSPIILKKWSMKTSLQKEELTRIPIWVKLHDVPIQVFEEDGISLIATYPVVNKKHNNKGKSAGNIIPRGFPVRKGFQVGKDFGFKPRAPNDQASSKVDVVDSGKIKLANIATPNPFTTLDEEEDEEEDVKNIYDESKNLNIKNTGANNYYIDRRELWSNLVGHAGLISNRPWVLLGDSNAVLNLEDHLDGGYEPNAAMHEFKECVQAMEVSDVNCTGLHFTWNQKPKGSNGILKKIDRIMGNLKFSDDFLRSFAIFQPYRISNHSPCVLRIPKVTKPKPKPFKFSNFLVYKEGFREVVESGWDLNMDGCNMYHVVKRLNGLKSPFRKLLHA